METITEVRRIALPHMPEIAAVITPKDENGKRSKIINVSANADAKIIHVLEWVRKRC